MKIMFYINTLGIGGAERVMSHLANRFSELGHEVELVTSFQLEREYPLSQDVIRYNLEEQKLRQSKIKRNLSRILKLRKLCKKNKPDVLVSFMQEPNFRAILATAGLRTKTVISVRNDPEREYAGKMGRFVGKHILPMADKCVFQTQQAKEWFPEKLQKKSTIIFNAVSESFFDIERRDPKNVVTLGRLSEQKNHELLILAFSKIADKHPSQNLLIYGQGDKEPRLRWLINTLKMENRIFLMGATENAQGVLSEAGAFVLSSNYEGMPNALMEAMAAGLPCISTDCPCGGPKMLIKHGENGMLVPVANVDALAESIDKILSDGKFAESIGKKAKESASQYLPKSIFKQWEVFITNSK